MTEAEKNFSAENGMTPQKAWEYVARWSQEGKIPEAVRGCKEILRFFPENREAKMLLQKLEDRMSPPSPPSSPSSSPQKTPHSVGAKKNILSRITHAFSSLKSTPVQNSSVSLRPDELLAATFSYIPILLFLPLFLRRDSQYVQFHAWQGLVLVVLISALRGTLEHFRLSIVHTGVTFTMFLLLAFLCFLAFQGKRVRIPLIQSLVRHLIHIFTAPEVRR